MHESNTFIRDRTTLAHFETDVLASGTDLADRFRGAPHEVGGFFAGLQRQQIEAVPIFAARAMPYGIIEAETFQTLHRQLLGGVSSAGPLDGVLAAVHGAAVSESHGDADGFWLAQLRRLLGLEVPIVATLDPHANLSAEMVDATTALIAYRTNPHIDQRERGEEAATLMARTLRGEVTPVQAAAIPPMAIDIERQHTTEPPCRELIAFADAQRGAAGVLSNSILLGFPYADVAEMGCAAVVVVDNDAEQARQLAVAFDEYFWSRRSDFVGEYLSVDDALTQASDLEGPVCLLDMGDNVGGGAPGDGTFLAHAIHERKLPAAFACLYDPASVVQAETAGTGKSLPLALGGKTDDQHGQSLHAPVTVRSLHDGRFEETGVTHAGMTQFDQGRTAIVETQHGLLLMLTSKRMAPFSIQQLISCGLDPARFHILVAKGVHAPRASYEKVCRHFLRVDTPGVTRADMTRLEYQHRRRPLFPFETK